MCYNVVVRKLKGRKIMEKKEVLQKLNNQYFKSLKRFKKMCKFAERRYEQELKEFNDDYLKIISAVINHDTYGLDLSIKWIYTCATINEKNELKILIDSVPTND